MRWEFRPGSALFVAWNENRAGGRLPLPTRPPLVKVSYWLPL
jgi:hypothetical protein